MSQARKFEALVLPHLNAAFNLACWLVRDPHVAEDMVQDAFLRAFRYFDSLRGDQARAWVLGIVRNQCFTWLEEQRMHPAPMQWDDDASDQDDTDLSMGSQGDIGPDLQLDTARQREWVNQAIAALAPPFREVLVLRELEDLSYGEIAQIVAIPIGTVMSRLSRARAELKLALAPLYRGNDHE